jgi:hypothetical protein
LGECAPEDQGRQGHRIINEQEVNRTILDWAR